MTQTVIRKTKWFWPWQDAQEETWLEQMSREGSHLKRANIMAQYDFIQGQPEDFAYRLDFRDSLKRKNKEEYIHLFNDAGWEYLGEMGGWQYFRKPAQPGDDKEIFTDPNTKIQKYKRYLSYLSIFYASDLILLIALLDLASGFFLWLYIAIFSLFTVFVLVTWIKITGRIGQLKSL